MTLVYRPTHPEANENGMVEKQKAEPHDGAFFMPDIKPFLTQEGTPITSRSHLRAYEQKHGIKQVGTDYPGPTKPAFWDEHRARDKQRYG